MASSISGALERIKEELGRWVPDEAIEQACRDVGHVWRRRVLDPARTIQVFVQQVLAGNTSMTALPHLSGLAFTASAYCRARQRLPGEVVRRVVGQVARGAMRDAPDRPGTWMGHRTFLADGSTCSMPETAALRATFGLPPGQAPGCGFPMAKLVGLYDVATGLVVEPVMEPWRRHEQSQVGRLHPRLHPGDLVVADRGLSSYGHLAVLEKAGIHGLFRAHQRYQGVFQQRRRGARQRVRKGRAGRGHPGLPGRLRGRIVRRVGRDDYWVEWIKPKRAPAWMGPAEWEALPARLRVRELRYRVRDPGCRTRTVVLVTSLLDPVRYPKARLATLYGVRWEVEQNWRDLKQTLRMDPLHGQSEDIVRKELAVYALVYNLVRLVIVRAARHQRVPARRISFADAVRWVRTALPGQPVARLVVNPRRRGRHAPRVVKRRPKQYPRMTKPRHQYRESRDPCPQVG